MSENMPERLTMDRTLDYWHPVTGEVREIQVSISVPEPHPRFDWMSTLTIHGFDEPYSKTFYGCDAIHALTLTLGIVPSVLQYLTRGAPGRITWRGSDDLRFPALPNVDDDDNDESNAVGDSE